MLVAAVLLSLGRYRGELGTALAGLLILSYAVVSLIGCLVAYPFWRKAQFKLEQVTPGQFSLAVTESPPQIIRFLCSARLHIRLYRAHCARKEAGWSLVLPVIQDTGLLSHASPGRGVYLNHEQYLVLQDFASFFSFRRYSPANSSIERVLYPATPEPHAARSTVSGVSGQVHGKSTFDRSENLYETRTYLPGDDPRKINWKVFAHSGALAIREGELLPPPAAELFCILNTNSPERPNKARQQVFTDLVNRVVTYLLEQIEDRKTVILLLPDAGGNTEFLRIEPGNTNIHKTMTEALALPALDSPEPDFQALIHLLPPRATLLVFSLPGARIFTSPVHKTHWFTGPYPLQAEQRSLVASLKKWLFISNNFGSSRTGLLPSDFTRYGSRLEEEGIHAHIL